MKEDFVVIRVRKVDRDELNAIGRDTGRKLHGVVTDLLKGGGRTLPVHEDITIVEENTYKKKATPGEFKSAEDFLKKENPDKTTPQTDREVSNEDITYDTERKPGLARQFMQGHGENPDREIQI